MYGGGSMGLSLGTAGVVLSSEQGQSLYMSSATGSNFRAGAIILQSLLLMPRVLGISKDI